MKDKDSILLENLYNQVLEGTKSKSKKQVGYLLSKGSPLKKKQKEKLKKELHTGKVKVESSSYPIGRSGSEHELEFDWTDEQNPKLNGYWIAYYDYDASGSHSYGSYDEPPSSNIEITIEYLRIEKAPEQGENEVVYDNEDLRELKVSNPDLYDLVSTIKELVIEHEQENEDNYEQDYRGEPEYNSDDY
jgi:hypothetical protein